MYVHLPDGTHFHFGAETINSVIGRSFGRASDVSGDSKRYAGSGIIREERSTGELATFVVEESSEGEMAVQFIQGDYETTVVTTTGLTQSRPKRSLPWTEGCRRAEYGLSIYDPLSEITPRSSEVAVEYSSASTGMGLLITLRNSVSW